MTTFGPSNDTRFLTLVLWLCALGALWLLVSPAASKRRALAERADQLDARLAAERKRNQTLQAWRKSMEEDPSALEREARRMGYGRPGERSYPASPDQLNAMADALRRAQERAQAAQRRAEEDLSAWDVEAKRSVADVLMFICAAAAAVLFCSGMKIKEK